MTELMVNKLMESFEELERSINFTKQALAERSEVSFELINRLNEYSQIVTQQKALAQDLRIHIANQDWKEINRHVILINSLSEMIREDAQGVVSGFDDVQPSASRTSAKYSSHELSADDSGSQDSSNLEFCGDEFCTEEFCSDELDFEEEDLEFADDFEEQTTNTFLSHKNTNKFKRTYH